MVVLKRYEEIFTVIPEKASLINHKIDLIDDRPVGCGPCPLPHGMGFGGRD